MAGPYEIHWSEGQFLRPHHLQLFSRGVNQALANEARRLAPYGWGIEKIAISENELAAFSFSVRELRLRMRDGILLNFPGNAKIEPREFKEALAKSGGNLDVFLGVPRWNDSGANVIGPDQEARPGVRYFIDQVERPDENTGGNPQPVEVRVIAARIFFGGDNTDGYDTIQIARVRRRGTSENLPVLAPEYAPALLSLSTWPLLANRVEDLVHRLTAISRASASALLMAGGGKIRESADLLSVLRLQTTRSYAVIFRQLLATPGLHPYAVFLELLRLAGDLALFGDLSQDPAMPKYDHDNLASSFGRLIEHVDRLLTDVAAPTHQSVRLILNENRLEGPLEADWAEGTSSFYLGFESDYTHSQVDAMIRGAKIGSVQDLPTLVQRRLPGLQIERLTKVPGDLPEKPEVVYFKLKQEGEFWGNVMQSLSLGIVGFADPAVKVTLYFIPGA